MPSQLTHGKRRLHGHGIEKDDTHTHTYIYIYIYIYINTCITIHTCTHTLGNVAYSAPGQLVAGVMAAQE